MKPISQKQKVLMAVLREMNKTNNSSRTFLEKALFILRHEEGIDKLVKFYSFFPYNYGPFSHASYEDIGRLQRAGLVTEKLQITQKGHSQIVTLPKTIDSKITAVVNKFSSTNAIQNYVYKKYPEYTVKSKLKTDQKPKPNPGIFTIGYEGKDIDAFLDILIKNRIDIVVDIRFNPFSMNFDFIQSKLQNALNKAEIGYVHIPALGIEGALRKDLNSAEDYKQLFDDYKIKIEGNNQGDIDRIISLGREKRIVLLCFEHDKNMCHRGVVAEEIEKEGIKTCHL